MSSEKSVAIIPQTPKQICPICGKASYSAGGVHPQCAMQQADQPRLARLRASKAADSKKKNPTGWSWKKKCPKCGTQLPARQSDCACGHKFGTG